MGYSAGNLDVTIQAVSNNAIKSLDAVISRLNTISPLLQKMTKGTIAGGIAKSKGGSSSKSWTEQSYLTNKLGKQYLSMSKAVTKTGKALQSTTVYFSEQGKEIKRISQTIDQYGNKVTKTIGGTTKSKKSGSAFSFLNIAKWSAVIYAGRRFGRVLGNIVQAGADYTETLNLWETAMGSNLNVATEFVNKMNEAYGISEKTLMNAQAIFKNMLGSLGQISDTMAYSLSEGITQMALDYASLYNVTFEQAFTKFQAALAGQVRPIRSVAGYDITETTLYQLYQSLGGTKTMRQLYRTEKQLLSILAIFNQMDKSGAVGDLSDTMGSFANQSRVMAEAWQQVLSYSGILLTHLLQESGLLVKVNSILIFIGDTLKAVVESMGAIEHFADPFEPTTDGALNALDAINEVQGKLLDFDKFRSMSGGEENALGLDEKLLQALSGYDTILANASMEARNLAENLKIASGLFDEDGTFNVDRWEELLAVLKLTGKAVLLLFGTIFGAKLTNNLISTFTELRKNLPGLFSIKTLGIGALIGALIYLYATNEDLRKSVNELFSSLSKLLKNTLNSFNPILNTGLSLLNNVVAPILKFLVDIIAWVVKLTDKLGILDEIIIAILSYKVATKLLGFINIIKNNLPMIQFFVDLLRTKLFITFQNLPTLIKNSTISFVKFLGTTQGMVFAFSALTAGIVYFISNLDKMSKTAKILIPILSVLLGIVSGIAVAKAAAAAGIAAPVQAGITAAALAAGLTLVAGTALAVNKFAEGGLPDRGTMFLAGEAGAEIVYNTPSGQSGVANIQQIAQATKAGTLQAVKEWWAQAKNDIPQFKEVSKTGIYEVAKSEMRRRGEW